MTYIPVVGGGGGGNDSRFGVYETNVGNGTTGPYTVTHNLNTRSVFVNVYRNAGGTVLTGALNGQQVQVSVRYDPSNQVNAIILEPDENWGTNEMHVVVTGVLGSSDQTAPTVPTLTVNSTTTNSATVTASNSTDAGGIGGYNFYLNGTYVGSSSGSYMYQNLGASIQYSLSAQAYDVAGNLSAAGTATATTAAGNKSYSLTIAGTTKPASLPDWGAQTLNSYVVSNDSTVAGTTTGSTDGNYYGGGVFQTPTDGPLHQVEVTIGNANGGSSNRGSGAAVGGTNAAFAQGVFAIGAGSGICKIIYKNGTTFTEMATNTTAFVPTDKLKLVVTKPAANYVYTVYKNGSSTATLSWTDTGNVFVPGQYGGFAMQVIRSGDYYGPPGITGAFTLKDNAVA